ncbi:MAG: AmmeMemoRadiSam system radical SAM enzyme [Bryobacteraceae bacterium]
MQTLASQLSEQVREGILYEKLDRSRVRCYACGHRCPIPEGFAGVCRVRFNRAGTLYAPYGYVSALHCDPIEKKPFFHALPGTRALSFGMLGCDLHCGYCQNWVTSQALRDFRSTLDFRRITPRQIVEAAIASGASSVVSTYNEPLITSEWAAAVFHEARAAGLVTGFVSNGNATPRVLEYLRPWVDLYKVDLKSFDDRRYHELGGRLGPILDSIRQIHSLGFWLEVVTLVVPGFNDSQAELESLAAFLADISPDIPWHVTAFHEDYKMFGNGSTPVEALLRALEAARSAGLRYAYAGNLPHHIRGLEDTQCRRCGAILVERSGMRVLRNTLTAEGRCPHCAAQVPGVWRGLPLESREAHQRLNSRCG